MRFLIAAATLILSASAAAAQPADRFVTVNGLRIHYVDWGGAAKPPLVFITHRTWIRRIRPLYRDMHNTRQAIDGHATEAFGGIRVVRSFGRQRTETSRIIRADQFRARQEVHVWWWSRAVDVAWELLIPAASAILLLYGGIQVLDGRLTLGDLFLFFEIEGHSALYSLSLREREDLTAATTSAATPAPPWAL